MPSYIQQQRQAVKEIIDTLYFSKMKNFCSAKDSIKEDEKTNHARAASDNGVVQIQKELLQTQ